jgi:hypothetical protein
MVKDVAQRELAQLRVGVVFAKDFNGLVPAGPGRGEACVAFGSIVINPSFPTQWIHVHTVDEDDGLGPHSCAPSIGTCEMCCTAQRVDYRITKAYLLV